MNKDLANSTKLKLTKRHMMNERARLALQLNKVNDRLVAIGLGEVKGATSAEVTALKTIQNKLLSDISPEDLESAVDAPKTQEELAQGMKEAIQDNELMKDVIRMFPKEAIKLRDQLNKALPVESKVTDIRTVSGA